MTFHRRWLRKAVWNDDGFEVTFRRRHAPGFTEVEYSAGGQRIVVIGERALILWRGRKKWGLHFDLADRYLSAWADGIKITPPEQQLIRSRINAALDFLDYPHSMDLK